MPGTGHCALTDSIELTRAAVELGCAGVLMLPPFYYKGVSDEGLYRNFAEVIERVGDERLQLYLYHIPPVAQVPITLPPDRKAAVEVSRHRRRREGFLAATGRTPRRCSTPSPRRGFDVFAGSEVFLLDNMRNGGKGCITATGNINPGPIANVYKNWRSADADKLQAGITATRKIVQKQPMIPALKAAVAHFGNDPQWKTCRPPLVELTAAQEEELITRAEGRGLHHARPRSAEDGARHRRRRAASAAPPPRRCAKPGCKVFGLDRESRAATVVYDLTDLAGIPALVARLGEIDVLVNNAGVQAALPIDRYTDEARRRILRINLEAPVELIRAASKAWLSASPGASSTSPRSPPTWRTPTSGTASPRPAW